MNFLNSRPTFTYRLIQDIWMSVSNLEKIANDATQFQKTSIRNYESHLFDWKYMTHSDCSEFQYLHYGLDYFWSASSKKRVLRIEKENDTALEELSR